MFRKETDKTAGQRDGRSASSPPEREIALSREDAAPQSPCQQKGSKGKCRPREPERYRCVAKEPGLERCRVRSLRSRARLVAARWRSHDHCFAGLDFSTGASLIGHNGDSVRSVWRSSAILFTITG